MDKSKEKFSKVPGNRDQREQVYENDVNIIWDQNSHQYTRSKKAMESCFLSYQRIYF